MHSTRRFRFAALVAASAFLVAPMARAGTMSLAWDPVAGATGYRVYYGTAPGQYSSLRDVGNATAVLLDGLTECTSYHVAVKAYNALGESAVYSDELEGWPRPHLAPAQSPVLQGSELVLELAGSNFEPQADLSLDPSSVPLDVEGQPLITLDSHAVLSCAKLQAVLRVEPTARGLQAMQLGQLPLKLGVSNPDGAHKTGSVLLTVGFNPDRADVNQENERTLDRVDGDDLASLAHAWAAQVDDEPFEFDADLDGDLDIDGEDLALMASLFGHCRSVEGWTEGACP